MDYIKIIERFDNLIEEGNGLLTSRKGLVNISVALPWSTKCLAFIGEALGKDSEYYKTFNGVYGGVADSESVSTCRELLKEAKGDFIERARRETTAISDRLIKTPGYDRKLCLS